jgi:hypothetical protein
MKPLYILIGALIVIAGLAFAFVSIFKPGKTSNTKPVTSAVVLADHATKDNAVSYMVDGVTNSTEDHRAIKITITNKARTLEVFSGYNGNVIISQSFANDTASYRVFLAGLQTVGFIKQNTKNTDLNYTGKCPLGYRFILNTSGIKDAPQLLWTSSCGNAVKGNFAGNLDSVKQLFKAQIPDYNKLITGVRI